MRAKSFKTQAFLSVAAVAVLCILTAATVAYLYDNSNLNNALVVGRNAITITESYTPPAEMKQGDNIFNKKVSITNTGSVPCYVRVFADFSDSEVKKVSYLSAVDMDSATAGDWFPAGEYAQHLPDGWVYVPVEDDPDIGGYYYYTLPIEPGEATPNLFQAVNAQFPDEASVQDFQIVVSAESVQIMDKNGVAFEGDQPWKLAWQEFLGRR